MTKALHIVLRTLVWSLIGLGLALVLALVRLDSGPVALDWLKPRIERALVPDDDAVRATAGGIELRLNKDARTLELVGVDVRYRVETEGEALSHPFLIFPEVGITLSVAALLKKGMIAASEIVAEAPSLIITRDDQGIIGLQSEADYGGRAEDIDFGRFLRQFALAAEPDGRLAFLQRLQIGGGRVAYYDRRTASALTSENADLVLARREGGIDGWLRTEIAQPSLAPMVLQLSGRFDAGADRIAFEADVADLMPADLPEFLPLNKAALPAEIAGLRVPVRATVSGAIALDGVLSTIKVDAEAAAGVVDLPSYLAEPLSIDGAMLEATIDPDLRALHIDRARIATRGAQLRGSGHIARRESEWASALDVTVDRIRIEDLPALWPPHLGKGARAWVLDRITTGVVTDVAFTVDLEDGDFDRGPLRDDAIAGRFSFEGLSVDYLDGLPPFKDALGSVMFDADQMAFDVRGGTNGDVSLKDGAVTITGIGKPGKSTTQLRVLATAEGTIEQALSVLDHPPLRVAEKLAIAPGLTSGAATATIDVRMPLYKGVTGDEAVVLAEAELTDLAIDGLPKLGDDVRMTGGMFALVVDEEAVRLEGTAEVAGVPLRVDVLEPLGGDEGPKRRIDLAGSLGARQLEDWDIAIDGLDGALGFEATVTETATHFWIDLEADLAALALAPPGLVWRKAAGDEGLLRASIAVPLDGPIEVRQFEIETGDLEASGSLALKPSNDALQTLVFDVLRLTGADATMRFSSNGEDGFEVVIEGERLDLDALFGKKPEIGEHFQRFHAILRTGQLRARGVELADVEADAVRTANGWSSASLIGALPAGGKLALELTPDGDERRLEVRSDNAGAVVQAFDFGQRIEGGSLQLSVRLKPGGVAAADGRFEIKEFVLRDAPLLARMLTLASLTGIGNLLGGEGIQVDHLIMPFALDDRRLTFTDGLMRGSQLGLTVKGDVDLDSETLDLAGTIIPVYSLNRLIGQVPIIGRILTGVDGRGAFAATYSIKGPNDDPTVYVNPLSILTPGLLRDLVGGLLSGTLEPPDIRETDD